MVQYKKGSNVILWCDGLKTKPTCESGKKGAAISDSSEDDHEDEIEETVKKKRKRAKNADEEEVGETRKKRKKGEEKDKKVQETIDKLIEKHGDKAYTPMQYRVWVEMCEGGIHPSLDTAPTSSMFNRAGGGSVKRKTGHASNCGEVVSAISDLISALSPRLVRKTTQQMC